MRLELVAEPLLAYLREELLSPAAVELLVERVNAQIDALVTGEKSTRGTEKLRAEVTALEGGVGRLVEALAKGAAYDAVSAALAMKDKRLREARTELARLAERPAAAVPRATVEAVQARADRVWKDLERADPDTTRVTLKRIFDRIVVKPLRGTWANGSRLEMTTRPWAVLLPRDASWLRLRVVAGAR